MADNPNLRPDSSDSAQSGGEIERQGPPVPDKSGPAADRLIRIFKGPNEVRSGWRLMAFLGIVFILGLALGLVARLFLKHPIHHHQGFQPATIVVGEGLPFLLTLIAAMIMGRFERRSMAQYGLPWRSAFGPWFWKGVIWGFLALTALLLMIRADQGFYFGTLALHGIAIIRYGAVWAFAFLVVGFSEEFVTRGYALFTLSTGIGFWPSAVILSVLFGALHLHNIGEDWVGALGAALIGLFFCFTLRRTGSLWFAIGLHAAWDFSESFLYAVPDSGFRSQGLLHSSFHGPAWLTGGSVGPEASWFVFVLIAALFVIFDRIYRQVRFPLPPDVK